MSSRLRLKCADSLLWTKKQRLWKMDIPTLLISNDLIVLNLKQKSDNNAGIGRDGKTKVKRSI